MRPSVLRPARDIVRVSAAMLSLATPAGMAAAMHADDTMFTMFTTEEGVRA